MNHIDPTPLRQPTTDFPYADTAVGGASHRNHVEPLAPWRASLPPFARDVFSTSMRFTSELRDYSLDNRGASGGPSVAGYAGPGYAPSLNFDFDAPDPEDARRDAVAFCNALDDDHGIGWALGIWFSGRKGFHVSVPGCLFGGFAPGPCRPLAARLKALARALCGGVTYATLDWSVYDPLRLWREPNTCHGKSFRYKIPLSLTELRVRSMADILALATHRRDDISTDLKCDAVAELVTMWQGCTTAASGAVSEGFRVEGGFVPVGQRHKALASLVGKLVHDGISDADTLDAMARAWAAKVMPDQTNLDSLPGIVASAMSWEAGVPIFTEDDLGHNVAAPGGHVANDPFCVCGACIERIRRAAPDYGGDSRPEAWARERELLLERDVLRGEESDTKDALWVGPACGGAGKAAWFALQWLRVDQPAPNVRYGQLYRLALAKMAGVSEANAAGGMALLVKLGIIRERVDPTDLRPYPRFMQLMLVSYREALRLLREWGQQQASAYVERRGDPSRFQRRGSIACPVSADHRVDAVCHVCGTTTATDILRGGGLPESGEESPIDRSSASDPDHEGTVEDRVSAPSFSLPVARENVGYYQTPKTTAISSTKQLTLFPQKRRRGEPRGTVRKRLHPEPRAPATIPDRNIAAYYARPLAERNAPPPGGVNTLRIVPLEGQKEESI